MKKIKVLAIAGVFTASLAAAAFAEMADVKVSGEIRVRDVIKNNYDLDGDAGDSNNQISERTRVNVDATVNETTKAYISLQDTRTWGQEGTVATPSVPSTTTTGNEDEAVDVSQAYIQLDKLAGQPLSLKLGRQVLAYGAQRLIGALEWSDNARRFDAIKLAYNTDAFGVDLFTAKLDENSAGTDDGTFNGLYATVKTIPMNALDLYLLQKSNNTAGESMLTYGLRIAGGTMNIDWDAEYAMQGGDAMTDVSKDANMYVLNAGYTLPEVSSLRIGAEYVFASGDDSGTDDTGFDQLYPTNHNKYGVSDWAKSYNPDGIANNGDEFTVSTDTLIDLKAWSLNVGAKPAEGLKLVAEYWNYETDQDSVSIGSEFNIQAWYALSTNVELHAYWARFMPGSDLEDLEDFVGNDSAEPADNVTVQLAVKF